MNTNQLVTKLRVDNMRLREMLRECAETFRGYADKHRRKITMEGDDKARANEAMVERIGQALKGQP